MPGADDSLLLAESQTTVDLTPLREARRLGPLVPWALTRTIMKEMSVETLPNLPTPLVTHVAV